MCAEYIYASIVSIILCKLCVVFSVVFVYCTLSCNRITAVLYPVSPARVCLHLHRRMHACIDEYKLYLH